jgi:predicted ArsR family transcriptional regulator
MEELNNSREKILYYLRDKGESKSKDISDNMEDLDRDAVNFRLKKLRNLGFVKSYDDREDTPKGGRRPVQIHSPNLNKIDNYTDEYGELSIPSYKTAEMWDNVDDTIIELENRLYKLEQSQSNTNSRIDDVEDKISYLMDWVSTAENYMVAFRYYINRIDEQSDDTFSSLLNKIEKITDE